MLVLDLLSKCMKPYGRWALIVSSSEHLRYQFRTSNGLLMSTVVPSRPDSASIVLTRLEDFVPKDITTS